MEPKSSASAFCTAGPGSISGSAPNGDPSSRNSSNGVGLNGCNLYVINVCLNR